MTNQPILHNIRILDFTWVLAGPYATRILADFGAEVLKVQSLLPEVEETTFSKGYYNTWNRNKLGITLNLNKPQGVALAKRLVSISDAVVENFAPRMGFIVPNLSAKPKGVVHFYNGRGTAEQWIKEGKYALNWTRLSCHRFVGNQVRLQLFILAYNLGNFLCRLGLPKAIKGWSLRSLQVKLIKIGGRMVHHAWRIIFQLAEVVVPRELLAAILEWITRLRLAPG